MVPVVITLCWQMGRCHRGHIVIISGIDINLRIIIIWRQLQKISGTGKMKVLQ